MRTLQRNVRLSLRVQRYELFFTCQVFFKIFFKKINFAKMFDYVFDKQRDALSDVSLNLHWLNKTLAYAVPKTFNAIALAPARKPVKNNVAAFSNSKIIHLALIVLSKRARRCSIAAKNNGVGSGEC